MNEQVCGVRRLANKWEVGGRVWEVEGMLVKGRFKEPTKNIL